MMLDAALLKSLTVGIDASGYVRIIRRAYAATPLGMGLGRTRFSSPDDRFRLMYAAQDSMTALAEVLIRDRYQGKFSRELPESELDDYCIVELRSLGPLVLLDLRHQGAHVLGVATDAVRGRNQLPGRRLSQELYDRSVLDGIVYMSRITNRECVAIYDRAVGKLEVATPVFPLSRLASLVSDLAALRVRILTI